MLVEKTTPGGLVSCRTGVTSLVLDLLRIDEVDRMTDVLIGIGVDRRKLGREKVGELSSKFGVESFEVTGLLRKLELGQRQSRKVAYSFPEILSLRFQSPS